MKITDKERLRFLIKLMNEGYHLEMGKLANDTFYLYPSILYSEAEGQYLGMIENKSTFEEAIDSVILAMKEKESGNNG